MKYFCFISEVLPVCSSPAHCSIGPLSPTVLQSPVVLVSHSPVAPGVLVLDVSPDLLKPAVLLVVHPEVLDVVRVLGGVAAQDVGRVRREGDHGGVLVVLDRVGSHPMPTVLCLQVPVVLQ